MEWINFKDQLPEYEREHFIIYGDSKIGISFYNKDYGFTYNNVKYWMKIPPIPEELHECFYKCIPWKKCKENENGDLWFSPDKGCFIQVNFCPFCGFKAPNQQEDEEVDDEYRITSL